MNKKITQFKWLVTMLLLVTAMVMPFTAWADTITPKKPSNGDGSAASPYQIGTAAELYWFAGLVNGDTNVCDYNADTKPEGTQQNTSACAVLTANITVNSGVLKADGSIADNVSSFRSWTPIGNYNNEYTGTFDGQGYTVSGLYFKDTSKEEVGLFGHLGSGGKISNVGVLDSYFEFRMMGGGICGHNYGEINNCTNGGTVIGNSTGSGAGGVCGMNYGTVKDCKNTGSVSGTVTGIGGVCGAFYSGSIENCLNEGTVSGTGNTTSNSSYGGVCGQAKGGVIKLSSNTASIRGYNAVGGVCGSNMGATLEDCYNTGAVIGTALSSFGGVCGSNSRGSIKNCYNTGAVSGNNNVGGVCGKNSGTITNCYYLSGTATGGINGEDATGSAESKSLMHFTSGEVAYLLNEGKAFGTQVWGQQLGVNDYPVLGSAYKVLMAARDGLEGSIYWATFSNLNSNAELIDPMGGIAVYNATVSDGTLTLAKRSDNNVSSGEGVLLKANREYVNAKNISDYVAATTGENDLLATPAEAGVLNDTNYKHYRLTYNDVDSKEGIGFYLGVVKDETGKVTSNDGSQIKVTPGKAYLKVSTQAATKPSTAKLARGFAFPGDGETTGIECITVTDESLHSNGNAKGIFDLQGRKVSKPTKGVYINNGKKVIIK